MSKVVIERPRDGYWLHSHKTRLRIRRYDPDKDYDDLPKRVSGSKSKYLLPQKGYRTYGKLKHFSDLIGPLQRYLRGSVGRYWDDVYSEMKRTLDSRKVTGNHVFEHVDCLVELKVRIGEDGNPYDVPTGTIPVSGLYVDPRTGLLCWEEHKKKATPEKEPAELTYVLLSKNSGYFKLQGIWHFAEFIKGEIEKDYYWNSGTGCWVRRSDRHRFPQVDHIYLPEKALLLLLKKEALTRKERKAAGLHNDPQTAGIQNANH